MKIIITLFGTMTLSLSLFAQGLGQLNVVDWETPESNRSIKIYAEHNPVALEILNTVASDVRDGNIQFLNIETGNAFVCITASNKTALAGVKAKLSKFMDRASESSCR